MRVLLVHPGPLMYTRVFLRLEPLGLELVAESARRAGHQVRLIDLQVERPAAFEHLLGAFRPDVVAIGCNYLANVPEVLGLAATTRRRLPEAFVLVGGHSASFVGEEMLAHAGGALDGVLRGEGEAAFPKLLAAVGGGAQALRTVPGLVTAAGAGAPPTFTASLDDLSPARDLLRHRRKYFIGVLDPCASIEFSRGCPWDCSFCSAWTFYGRSYRMISPEKAADDLAAIKEPGVFLLDDVAFIHDWHGMAIGEAVARRGIRKRYYMETRADVLLRNKEVFRLWTRLGLRYLFVGLEAIDEEGLKAHRKRVALESNFEALAFARSLGLSVAINIIADPDWDEARFAAVRQWCLEVPEVVNISVNTPYPGTETWAGAAGRLTTRDYRLFDIQHAVTPTRLPLDRFYRELVATQQILNRKHLGWRALTGAAGLVARHLAHGQTNFLRMLWKFDSVFNPEGLLADHARPIRYELSTAPGPDATRDRSALYVHPPQR